MYRVVVECPSTNKAVYTGLILNEADFPALLNVPRQVQCPYCGGAHVWFKHDAVLLDENEVADQIFNKEHPPHPQDRNKSSILP